MSILQQTFNHVKEPDIRAEVRGMLYGIGSEPPRGHWVQILRVNLNRPCCINKHSGKWDEPNPNCKACEGLGFFPTKVYTMAFYSFMSGDEKSAAPEILHIHGERYYVTNEVFVDQRQAELSALYEILLDANGNIVEPVQRVVRYNIKAAVPYREDHGKLQYWALNVEKQEV